MIPVDPVNEEVLYATDPIVRVAREDIEELVRRAHRNARKRIRICAHRDVGQKLHEMLIVHTRETYVRPHKHIGKTESFHVIQGEVDIVVFAEDGALADVIQMGHYATGKAFYYRIADPLYHTLLIRSDVVIFHETTNGPFRYEDMVFAPWEPDPEDPEARQSFIGHLDAAAARFLQAREAAGPGPNP